MQIKLMFETSWDQFEVVEFWRRKH